MAVEPGAAGGEDARSLRLAEARKAHERGWALTPLSGKRPTLKGWTTAPRPSIEQVETWARAGNVGVRTGAVSGVVVIDEDSAKGGNTAGLDLPRTPTVLTGGGGRHFYFRVPLQPIGNSAGRLGPHVDVRGDGGQVVLVGSVHPETGRTYRWADGLSPDEVELAPFPDRLVELLGSDRHHGPRQATPTQEDAQLRRYAEGALAREAEAVSTAPEGTRNDRLNAAAFQLGRYVGAGLLDPAHVQERLADAAASAGLDRSEALATLLSGTRAGIEVPHDLQDLVARLRQRQQVWFAGATESSGGLGGSDRGTATEKSWTSGGSGGGGPGRANANAPPLGGSGGARPGGAADSQSWPDPRPVPELLPAVPPFDAALLPESFRPWIEDIAERIQCPIDFPAVGAMVALAAIVGRRVGIRPKQRDDWLVVPNLWGGVIGRPGIMKTPALTETQKPLKRLEIQAKRDYAKAIEEYTAKGFVAKQERKVAEKAIRKALEDEASEADLAEIASDALEAPEKPVRRRYIVNDCTVEKLGELLNENPMGVEEFRDELIGFLRSLDKEGHESARAFYLEAWNGDGRFTYDRIARGTVEIDAATVSILGGIQPGPLQAYLNDAVGHGERDDGLLQRFQLLVWPDIGREWRNVDRWPDTRAKTEAYNVFVRLDKLDAASIGAETDQTEPDGIPFLRFDPDAQELFNAWREGLETRLRNEEQHPAFESHIAKYRSLVPSLALLIHLADGKVGPVGVEALGRALRWVEYLEAHARRVYAAAIRQDVAAARAIAKRIQRGDLPTAQADPPGTIALRDIYHKGWSGLTDRERVDEGVRLLVELDWLREERTQKPVGAPRTRYVVNPKIPRSPTAGTDKTSKSPAEGDPDCSGGLGGSAVDQADDEGEAFEP